MAEKEDILRKVRALLDRAASTNFDAERDECMKKADQLMTAYTIESWELEFAKPAAEREKPKLVEYEYGRTGDQFIDTRLYELYYELAKFCRVKIGWLGYAKAKVVGYEADLAYLDQIFTGVRLHMAMNMMPRATPMLPYVENLALLKEAGYKWQRCYEELVPLFPDLFKKGEVTDLPEEWPEDKPRYSKEYELWLEQSRDLRNGRVIEVAGRKFSKTMPRPIGVRFTKEYTEFCKAQGRERVYSDPTVFRRNFAEAYTITLRDRIYRMQTDRASGMELVLAGREEELLNALHELFPNLKPHPEDCDCEMCHRCSDPACRRTNCVNRRKPVRYRSVPEQKVDMVARERGRAAAATADLQGSRHKVGDRKQLS